MPLTIDDDRLLKAAINASNVIAAFYEWFDSIEKAGGTTSIEGVAKCHAMLKSAEENKAKIDRAIIEPLSDLLVERMAQHAPDK